MTNNADISQRLAGAVREAAANRVRLAIRGNGTKAFYTGKTDGTPLDVTGHRGIVAYEPTELVLTARAGTPLAEIEAALAGRGQMLGFEPPYFGETATLGGTIACGFSGPRRPYAGAARDFVLGAKIINGKGEILRFGGQVMKNVAGFDVSRLMVGALGTLGVLLEVSLKVLPKPARELTLTFGMSAADAIRQMNAWAAQPLPLSASCHLDGTLYIRLSGSEKGVQAAQQKLGGEALRRGDEFWRDLREQRLDFFGDPAPLWRLSIPSATPPIDLPGKWFIDWGGAQRWLKSDTTAADIRQATEEAGGHAALFRSFNQQQAPFAALPPELIPLHRKLRLAFDPHAVLNPGSS